MSYDKVEHNDAHELAAPYALGALTMREARSFEESLTEGVALCDSELHSFIPVVSRLGLTARNERPPAVLREKLAARISMMPQQDRVRLRQIAEAPSSKAAASPPIETSGIRAPVGDIASASRGAITVRASEGLWTELYPGVMVKQLFTDESRGTVTSMVRLMAGGRIPHHYHAGIEECVVLEGCLTTGGQDFYPGDYRCMLAGTTDADLSSTSGALVMLVCGGHSEFADQ